MFQSLIETPLGRIRLTASKSGIRSLELSSVSDPQTHNSNEWSEKGIQQLAEYFDKKRENFDLAYDFSGYSDFYRAVWSKLTTIKYGSTCSYLDIAKSINNPKSVRAVGMANGKNPIGIIVPCHRVIGSDGSLTGYAQGLEMNKWLLEFEGALQPNKQFSMF